MGMQDAQEERIKDAIRGVTVNLAAGAGDASAANQTTEIARLTSILAKQGLPTQGAPTDRSGTLTTGGTSQQVMAANATRVYLFVQNISAGVMYINFGAAAVVDSNSIKLAVNGSWENPPHFCPNGTVTIIGATTGQKWVAKEL